MTEIFFSSDDHVSVRLNAELFSHRAKLGNSAENAIYGEF